MSMTVILWIGKVSFNMIKNKFDKIKDFFNGRVTGMDFSPYDAHNLAKYFHKMADTLIRIHEHSLEV